MRALERRYARLRQAGLAGTTLLVMALVVAFLASYRARLAAENRAQEVILRQRAQQAQAQAETAEQAARAQLYAALLEQGRATVRSGELGQRVRALEAVGRAAAIANTAELRGIAIAAAGLPDWRLERALPKAADTTLLQLDPGFERLAICRGDGPVEIYSASDRHRIGSLPASANLPAYLARWSSDGRFLAVKRDWSNADHLADVEVWEVAKERRLLTLKGVEYDALAFHPHRPQIVTALGQTNIAVWNLEKGVELRRFTLPHVPMVLAISPDGERLAVSYGQGAAPEVSICRLADGKTIVSHSFEDTVDAMDWDPEGRWLATADYSGAVQLLDSQTGQARLLGRHKVQAVLATFCPGGDYLLSAGWERELICWDLRRKERAFTLALDAYRAQFRSDGNECAVINDTEVQFHRIERPAACREFAADLGVRLHSAAFSPDNHWLAATGNQRLGVWDLTGNGVETALTQGAEGRLFFSPNGDLLASTDGQGYRWRLAPGRPPGLAPQLEALPFSQPPGFTSLCLVSNRVILTAQAGSCAWPVKEPEPAQPTWASTQRGISVGSPDGRWLAIYPPFSRLLHVYRVSDLAPVATLTNQHSIRSVEFSPQNDEVAVSSPPGVEIWSTANWQRIRKLNCLGLLYSPDARTLWLTKDYRTSGLYDARTLELLLPLPEGTCPLAISADAHFLAASVDNRRLKIWDLAQVNALLKEWGLAWQKR